MIRAMIFDLDGTLVQTEKLKALSYARAARALRPELEETDLIEAFKQVVGLSRKEVATSLVAQFSLSDAAGARMTQFGVSTAWQAFIQIRLEHYEDMLADPAVLLANQWPHNMALLRQAKMSCEKVGLATMSRCEQVQRVLNILELRDTFDFVASRDDVERGKPDPEIYLLVAGELGMAPEECLVVEDSPAGVAAALAAGMEAVAVSTPFTRARLRESDLLPDSRIVDEPATLVAKVAQIVRTSSGD